jgi:hypothetical protein
MRRFLFILLGLVLTSGLGSALIGFSTSSPQAYSIAEVQAALQHHPGAWAGRTILVRGWPAGFAGRGCAPAAWGMACRRYTAIYLASVPGDGTLPGNGPSTELTISLQPGTRQAEIDSFTTTGPLRGLLIVLHNQLPALFPWSGSSTVRLRVAPPQSCAAQNTTIPTCSVGVLLAP